MAESSTIWASLWLNGHAGNRFAECILKYSVNGPEPLCILKIQTAKFLNICHVFSVIHSAKFLKLCRVFSKIYSAKPCIGFKHLANMMSWRLSISGNRPSRCFNAERWRKTLIKDFAELRDLYTRQMFFANSIFTVSYLPSVTQGKVFLKLYFGFTESFWYSSKVPNPVVCDTWGLLLSFFYWKRGYNFYYF